MHMAFLSRVFKNLQWYGMTFKNPCNYVESRSYRDFSFSPCGRFRHEKAEKGYKITDQLRTKCGLKLELRPGVVATPDLSLSFL